MYKPLNAHLSCTLLCLLLVLCPIWGNGQEALLPDSIHQQLAYLSNDAERINFLIDEIEESLDKHYIKNITSFVADQFEGDGLLLEKSKVRYWAIKLDLEGEVEQEELSLYQQEVKTALYLLNQSHKASLWKIRFLALEAELAYRSADYTNAYTLNEQAINALNSQKLNTPKAQSLLGGLYRIKGNMFYLSGQFDSVFHYYQLARTAYQVDAQKNNDEIITLLINMGIMSGRNISLGPPDTFYQQALAYCSQENTAKRSEIYLEWGISTAVYAFNTNKYEEVYHSNELLFSALENLNPQDSLEVSRLYYQLGANYQNLAKFSYTHSDSLFQSALDSAAHYYKKTIIAATDENNKATLDSVYRRAAQICDFISVEKCENLLANMGDAYQDIYSAKEAVINEKKDIEKDYLLFQSKQKSKNRINRLAIAILSLAILLLAAFSYTFIQKQTFDKINFQSRLKALRAQMNPHFISNALNAIDSLVVQKKNELASEYIVDFSRLCRMILDSSHNSYITLKKEVQILEHFLSLEKLRLSNRLHVVWDISPALDLDAYLVPPLILQPFVENAVWHGILNKPNRATGMLCISIQGDDNMLHCIIEDDGVGRKKAKALRKDSLLEWQSWGMQITNERIEALQKIKDSKLEIVDLYDDHGIGTGTKVIISLPKILNT
jgi:two-component sensor histidine kinase